MAHRTLMISTESWPIRGGFAIARGKKTVSETVTVTLLEGGARGRGECLPYSRYGESIESVIGQIQTIREEIEAGMGRADLQKFLKPGAARNAVDCALWDLEAKQTGKPVWRLAGLPSPRPCPTSLTIGLDTPKAMARAAKAAADLPLLKIKLGGLADEDCITEVRKAAPKARLVIDANEGWTLEKLHKIMPHLVREKVELVEQPLPAGQDSALKDINRPIKVCADESAHTTADIAGLKDHYDAVNIKLDKTGGLTEAIRMTQAAERAGLDIFLGCMVATSLSMAPAQLLSPLATYVDLDGPLLLETDRKQPIQYRQGWMDPPAPALWG